MQWWTSFKQKAVKVVRYYWYSTTMFEAEDLPTPIWERRSGSTLIRIFNNQAAADADALKVADYGYNKVDFGKGRWHSRVVKVYFHDPKPNGVPVGVPVAVCPR